MLKLVKKLLITGAAGFIGAALSNALIRKGEKVIGLDSLNAYYDINLKKNRLENILENSKTSQGSWTFEKCKLEDKERLEQIFTKYKPRVVKDKTKYDRKTSKRKHDVNIFTGSGTFNIYKGSTFEGE